MTELLQRLGVAMGISLVLTLLLLVLYQDDAQQLQRPEGTSVSAAAAEHGTP